MLSVPHLLLHSAISLICLVSYSEEVIHVILEALVVLKPYTHIVLAPVIRLSTDRRDKYSCMMCLPAVMLPQAGVLLGVMS